jgi:hypothetical protein
VTTRGSQVYALLRAYVAYASGLRTSTGQIVSRGSTPGETPSKRIPCPVCKGTKRKRVRGVTKPCDECLNDKGQPTGRITVDSYTGRRRAGEQPSHRFTPQEMSGWELQTELALNRIEALLKMNEGEEAAHDSFSAAYDTGQKLLAQGSYPELARALTWLRDVDPVAHSLIWQAVIYAPFGPPAGTVLTACEAICETLAERLPERIEVPRWANEAAEWRDKHESLWRGRTLGHAEQRAVRDDEIRALHVSGTPVASIMATYSLSQAQVYRALADGVASVSA